MAIPQPRNNVTDAMGMFAQGLNMMNTFSTMAYNAKARPLMLQEAEEDLKYKKELYAYNKLKMAADAENHKQALVVSAWTNQRFGIPPSEDQFTALGEFLQTDPTTIEYDDTTGDITFQRAADDGKTMVPVTLKRGQIDEYIKVASRKVENYSEFNRVEKNLEKVNERYFSLDEEMKKMGPPSDQEGREIKLQRMTLAKEMDLLSKQANDMTELLQTFEPTMRPNIIAMKEQAGKMAEEELFKIYPPTQEEAESGLLGWAKTLFGGKRTAPPAVEAHDGSGGIKTPRVEAEASSGANLTEPPARREQTPAPSPAPAQTPAPEANDIGTQSATPAATQNALDATVPSAMSSKAGGVALGDGNPLPNPTRSKYSGNYPVMSAGEAAKKLGRGSVYQDADTGEMMTLE